LGGDMGNGSLEGRTSSRKIYDIYNNAVGGIKDVAKDVKNYLSVGFQSIDGKDVANTGIKTLGLIYFGGFILRALTAPLPLYSKNNSMFVNALGIYDDALTAPLIPGVENDGSVVEGGSLEATVEEELRVIPVEDMNLGVEELVQKYGDDAELFLNSGFIFNLDNGYYLMNEKGEFTRYVRLFRFNQDDDLSKVGDNLVQMDSYKIKSYSDKDDVLECEFVSKDGEILRLVNYVLRNPSSRSNTRWSIQGYPEGTVGFQELLSQGYSNEDANVNFGEMINPNEPGVVELLDEIKKGYKVDFETSDILDKRDNIVGHFQVY